MLPKIHRGLQSSEIRSLFSGTSQSLSNRFFRINWEKGILGKAQFVVILSKKIEKSAVKRNRLKRQVYQSLHHLFSNWTAGVRVAILIKSPAIKASHQQCHDSLKKLLQETGLLP